MEMLKNEQSKVQLDSDLRDENREFYLTNELAVAKGGTNILKLKKKFELFQSGKLEVEEIENDPELQKLIFGKEVEMDKKVEEDEEGGEKIEEEESAVSEYSVEEDQLEFEEEEGEEEENPRAQPLIEESESESEPNYGEDEEAEMERRGFVTMSRIDTYKRKRRIHNRLELKGQDHYESIMAKKFGNRKKAKIGSRTNQEKQKIKVSIIPNLRFILDKKTNPNRIIIFSN